MQWETDESFDRLLALLREHRSVVDEVPLFDSITHHILFGTNKLFVEGLTLRAHGIIPAAANLEPGLHRDLYRAVRAG